MRWRTWKRWDIFCSRIPRQDRIPSDKGYRFYVDHLIEEKDNEVIRYEGVRD